MSEQGKYFVIEGPDGTGKTTQAHLLVEALERRGIKSRYVHEPGETLMGLELERIIKDHRLTRDPKTDLLLFTANRLEVYAQVIKPALENGETVVADRNWLSSVAYQGVACGMGAAKVRNETRRWLPDEYMDPTFTTLLYVPEDRHRKMLTGRGTSEKDYFESKPGDFQQLLREGYEVAGHMVAKRHHVKGRSIPASAHIAAGGSIEEVHDLIIRKLEEMTLV
jgi:dTMP kinase